MDIQNIKGIGPKSAKLLNKLNIFSLEDLINYYPYRYNIYSFSNLVEKDVISVSGTVVSLPVVSYIKRNFNRLSFRCNINNNIVGVTIFNRAFLKDNIIIGKEIVLVGKYTLKTNSFVANDIKFNIKNGDIESIYHLTSGITNSFLSKSISECFNVCSIKDNIPLFYNDKYNFISKKEALEYIHFPKNEKEINLAKKRLIYEELFEFSYKMNVLNEYNKKNTKEYKNFSDDKINEFIKALPFSLTEDQIKVVKEISSDIKNNKCMNRLVLGDVGSGKTIVSAIAIYMNYLSGYQSALMAPTEILAIQHYYGIKDFLEKYHVSCDVIVGSMTKREKNAIYKRLENGEIDLLIGTHALLSDDVHFKKLGLVVTDEQHRFGVKQRKTLHDKSTNPDILYLSATPIPRTYALTIYGDLDISIIKTKPKGRCEIKTYLKKDSEIKDVLLAMLEEIKKSHQVYVVSPLVEQNDELDLTSVNKLKENLDTAFHGKIRCEIIHGKMRQDEKDAIMNDFKNGVIKILISTTVIEVGIDVKNATMMVIFNAERFGLASLHQLRGRVGRSSLQSYCYLISNMDSKRLKVMEESNDGFYISEKDFELRGHGDLFGYTQHGDMTFKLANLKNDYDILVKAKNDSKEFLTNGLYLDYEYYKKLKDNLNITD